MTDGKPVVLVLRYIRYLILAPVSRFYIEDTKEKVEGKTHPAS
jgi:hypothetical protein